MVCDMSDDHAAVQLVDADSNSLEHKAGASPSLWLSRVPVEVWQRILEYVPEQRNTDVWRSAMVDTSMLIPISQTSRYFRDITLSHPTPIRLGESVATFPRSGAPFMKVVPRTGWSRENRLDLAKIAPRVRELHIRGFLYLLHLPCPQLESLVYESRDPLLPISMTPRLHRLSLWSQLALPTGKLPHLTHLALTAIQSREDGRHARILGLLSLCPNLESFVLRDSFRDEWDNAPHEHEYLYPDLSLPRLRRVVLAGLHTSFLPFYLEKIPQPSHEYSLQIVSGLDRDTRIRNPRTLLLRHSVSSPNTIAIGLHLWSIQTPTFQCYTLSVALLGPRSFVRVGTTITSSPPCRRASVSAGEGVAWLTRALGNRSALRSVVDLWVVNLSRSDSSKDWGAGFEHPLRSTIAALRALEVVTIVVDHFQQDGEPDLGLLPDGREPGFNALRLKTVCLVHGYDRHMERRIDARNAARQGQPYLSGLRKPRETKQLSLARVLDQVRSGAFAYLDRLELRIALHFTVDEAELMQLREHIPQVIVEHNADERMHIPLPEYAREPEASGLSDCWEGVLY